MEDKERMVKESEDFGVIGEAIENFLVERLRSMGIGWCFSNINYTHYCMDWKGRLGYRSLQSCVWKD